MLCAFLMITWQSRKRKLLIWTLGHARLFFKVTQPFEGSIHEGKPVSRMLMDSRAIVDLMPYSLNKKLGGTDEELIKMEMNPLVPRGLLRWS